jgi:adenylate kinase
VDSLKIILLGAPGVGKGTQAKLICNNFNIPHISSGDLFRLNITENTPLGIRAKEYMEKGEFVPDDLTISMVKDRLCKEDCNGGFLLDGFPRNLYQAEELELFLNNNAKKIDKVLLIDIPKHLILERIIGRRICVKCGSSYHIRFNPSEFGRACQSCGEYLMRREDDKENVILNRLSVYNNTIKSVLDFYDRLGKLCEIKGDEAVEHVFLSICATLQEVKV